MIIWRIEETWKKEYSIDDEVYKKGNYLITANYRESMYRNKPVKEIGRFQAFWGARPCVVQLTQKKAEEWIINVCKNSKKLKKCILRG